MHNFDDLIYRGTSFTLNALNEVQSKLVEELQTSGSTTAVKNLQMVQLQKAIIAIGMFSLFESMLQQELSCDNGFAEAKKIIGQVNNTELCKCFQDFIDAVNVLKHGRGRSYDRLAAKSESLSFRLKLPGEKFFDEGDVSEVSTLIEVDDRFVLNCAEIIEKVFNALRTARQ